MPLVVGLVLTAVEKAECTDQPFALANPLEDPAVGAGSPRASAPAGMWAGRGESLGVTTGSSGLRPFVDGPARLATVAVSFGAAVVLAIGPVIWVLGAANGDHVKIDGGMARLATQLLAIAVFVRVASRRSRGLPVFGAHKQQ